MISFILAAYNFTPHNLGFIGFDEPIPEADKECKGAFIDTLTNIKGKTQIVIATQNRDIEEALMEAAKAKGLSIKAFELYKSGEGLSSLRYLQI